MTQSSITRRTLIAGGAAGAATLAAPWVRGAHAAGKLTVAAWDHWVPGANDTMTRLCGEWGAIRPVSAGTARLRPA